MRIWLDTDIGTDVDDALALAYVLRHPQLELVGISTVFGDLALRNEIAEAILAEAGAQPVPVLAGMGVPSADRRHGIMLGHEGIGILDDPKPTLRVRQEADAEQRIAKIGAALAEAEPDVVVAIGPMTNIGALVQAGFELPPLAIMGGKLQDVMLPGMVEEISEWNWYCDPVAVQRSLAAPHKVKPLVIPAEVTFTTQLEPSDIDRLAEGDGLNQCLARMCRQWLITQREEFKLDQPVVALHDPLTVAVLVEPELCTYQDRRVEIDDAGAAIDREGQGEPNLRAANTVDAEAMRAHLMDILVDNSPSS